VAAAREALSCGPLAELMAAITEPWTLSRALRNVGVAVRLRNLGIPADPSQARRKFCGPASSS
jgi:arabinofuranosyltransferase